MKLSVPALFLVLASTAAVAAEPGKPAPAAPASGSVEPDLNKNVTTTLRKTNQMLTNAYNKGYAAGLSAAAQAEGAQDAMRDLVKQAMPEK